MSNNVLNRFITSPKNFSNQKNPEDIVSQDYLEFYETIGKAIEGNQSSARPHLDMAMNVVLDGNLYSLEGYSSDKAIEVIQKKAGELMHDLNSSNDLPELDTVSLNSALKSALIIPNNDDSSIYYQSIQEENGHYVSTKPSNIIRNIFIQPSKILNIFKNIYLMGNDYVAKELISFVWVFWETILFFVKNDRIKLTPKQVCVILYIQKFATPFIDVETLLQKIEKKELQFDVSALTGLTWENGEINKVIEELLDLEIIQNYNFEDSKVYLVERVSLDIPVQRSSEF